MTLTSDTIIIQYCKESSEKYLLKKITTSHLPKDPETGHMLNGRSPAEVEEQQTKEYFSVRQMHISVQI